MSIIERNTSNQSAVTKKPDPAKGNILMGFWHNWSESPYSGSGYKQGFFRNLSLSEVPKEYNVIAVAFMKVIEGSGDRIPNFKPYTGTDEEFKKQVEELNRQERLVLISLGGADAQIDLKSGDENALAERIIQLAEKYGFNGLDIDLEQIAITAGDNQKVIPAALIKVKDYYRNKGINFIISMAPEFPHLRQGDKYVPYISSLEGYYDFIAPQFYNQGGDGVWVEGIGNLQQNNDAVKEDFLYYLTESIVLGSRGYTKIPHDKFVIGLPSNNDAAANGYVINPEDVKNALKRLKENNLAIGGLMTWSINWDGGKTKSGVEYNWEFTKRYGYISGGDEPSPEKPSIPAGLNSPSQTESSITLDWELSTGPNPIKEYTVYRDGIEVNKIEHPPYTDSGLTSDQSYRYQVSATDTKNNSSSLSSAINVSTSGKLPTEWQPDVWYADNVKVRYQNKNYICVMQHTSNIYWTPDKATSLWQAI